MKILNKIDLHLHIDGSAKPETVYEIARKYGIEPECGMTLEEIRKSMTVADGEYDPDFLTFDPPIRAMQTAEGISRITQELVEELERQGLVYAELRFAPQYHTQKGMTQEDAVKAAIEGLNKGLAGCKTLKAGLIVCAMNHCDPMDNHEENIQPQEQGYVPRPAWQVWAARIGLVVFIGIVIAQILQLAGMGL